MRCRGSGFRAGLLIVSAAGVLLPSACGGRSMLADDGELVSAGRGGTRPEPAGGSSGRSGSGGTGGTGVGRAGAAGFGGAGFGGAGFGGAGGSAIAGAAGAAMAGAAGAGMSGSAGVAGTGGSVTDPFPGAALAGCSFSAPLDGGFWQCESGLLHRPSPGACPIAVPRARAFELGVFLELEQAARAAGHTEAEILLAYPCREDWDCSERPNGYCALASPEGWSGGNFTRCRYGCSTDAECGGGTLCECGELGGRCVSASCFDDAECGEGLLCAPYDATAGCDDGNRIWECQQLDDECSLDVHCGDGQACVFSQGQRRCTPRVCP